MTFCPQTRLMVKNRVLNQSRRAIITETSSSSWNHLPGSDFQGSRGRASKIRWPAGCRLRCERRSTNVKLLNQKTMKKQVLFILSGLLLFSGVSMATSASFEKCEMPTTVTAPVGVWVKLSLVFHRPKLDCLKGFGFCFDLTWGVDGSGSSTEGPGCPVSMKLENDHLILQVSEKDLANYEHGSSLQYFSGKTSITLEDYTEVPAGISRELGSPSPIVIKPGSYPVTYQSGVFSVIFPI